MGEMSQVGFSPQGQCETLVATLISQATQTLDIASFSFTDTVIAQAILAAYNRGVKLRVVFDKSQTVGTQAQFYDQFEAAGIQVRVGSGIDGGIMHWKVTIADSHIVENGSFNYTESAQNKNYENVQIHDDPLLASAYTANFGVIWNAAAPEPVDLVKRAKEREERLKAFQPIF